MKQKITFILLGLLCLFSTNVSAALSKGDLAVIGMNSDVDAAGSTTRSFALVALSTIAANEVIYITDRGWINPFGSSLGSFTGNTTLEGTIQWTPSVAVPAGTVILFKVNMASAVSKTVSAVKGDGTAFPSGDFSIALGWTNSIVTSLPWNNTTGDQLLIYQGDTTNPSFIFAFNNVRTTGTTNTSGGWFTNPTGATSGVNTGTTSIIYSEIPSTLGAGYAVGFISNSTTQTRFPNEMYVPSLSTGTKTQWLANITNTTNWTNTNVSGSPYNFNQGFGATNLTSFDLGTTIAAPSVTTAAATGVGAVKATLGGEVTADGGATVTERGIVWATTANPTTADTTISNGTGTGSFNAVIPSLPAGTLVHFRAYAINSAGTSYGSDLTFTTNAALSASSNQTNVSCFGGSNGTATVVPSGGVSPYSYVWSPAGGTAITASGLTSGSYTCTITDNESTQISKNFTITQPTAISVTPASQTNIACNGGFNGAAAVNTPTGGAGGYTYDWTPGTPTGDGTASVTGLTAGTWTCTVTDANSCTASQSFTVTQPTAISVTPASQTNIACNGGSNGAAAVNTPTGGAGGYTYDWTPGTPTGDGTTSVTGLTAGTWTCSVTDTNGCTKAQSFAITQPATAISGTTVITNIACNGGSNGTINLTPSGGTAPYTFNWGGGITTEDRTGLAAGSYSVTITDVNGCTGTVNATVSQPATAVSGTTVITNIACNGGSNGSINLTPSGGTAPYTFNWGGGITTEDRTGLAAGSYSVTITDVNGCTGTVNATVTQPATAVSGTTVITNIACNGGSNGTINLTPSGGTAPYTFNWGGGITTEDRTGLAAGSYSVTITDVNGCTGTVNATVTQPATAVSGTTVITNIACNGGSNGTINLTPLGGTAPYTFNWGGGITTEDRTGLAAGSYSVTITDVNGCTGTVSATVTQPSALVVNPVSQTNIACFGGSGGEATVTASGGAGAYTYSWSPSGGTAATATGLTAGTYTVTITDANGCVATQSFTITQPAAITTTEAQTNVSCNGGTNGSASVTAIGGTGDYTYSWAPTGGTAATATGLAAGTYTVTITDANSCMATQTFTITQPDAITITEAQTNVSCNGGTNGSASVTAIGGTGDYTYSWAPTGGTAATATGLAAGTYTVTITDANGCVATRSFTITQPDAIATTEAQTNVSCNGGTNGSASVTAIGGTGDYTYSWAPSGGTAATATGLAAGTYTVTITDANSCMATRSFTITQPDAITTTDAQTNVSCNGGTNGSASVTAIGGAGDYTYSWSPSGGTAATATGLAAGTYTVTITDANSCTATRSFTITQPDAITATTSQIDILCNGAATGTASVTATGGTGAYTYSWSPSGGNAATATGLVAGTYNVTITDANACAIVKTITITEAAPINLSLQPVAISVTEGANATFSITASNATSYQWQVSTDGTSWTDVADGGTNPVYSGAATTTLALTNVPETFDGYLYRVSVSNSSTCSVNSDSAELTVTPSLKMEDFSSIDVTIYPNPASSQVVIKIPEFSAHSNCSVAVYDLNGRVIMQKRLTSESEKIDIAHLKSGVYIFNITSDRAKTTKRVVKY